MSRANVVMMNKKYEKLKLRESMGRAYDYPRACNELSLIIKSAYSRLPKNLHSLLFDDTLAAFRLLPQVQTQRGKRAANLLLHTAEVVFPKQKKVLAVAEFKHAVVAYKRRVKTQQMEGSVELPQDVLLHVFGFLDMHSLVAAGLVCRSWNSAANDNKLWQSQYHFFFRNFNGCNEMKGQIGKPAEKWTSLSYKKEESIDHMPILNWRDTFKIAYLGNSSKRFTSNRVYCGHCKSVVWLSNNMECPNAHHGIRLENQQIKPVSPQQVVKYLVGEDSFFGLYPDSDIDSDSDEGSTSKLWAYAKHW